MLIRNENKKNSFEDIEAIIYFTCTLDPSGNNNNLYNVSYLSSHVIPFEDVLGADWP